MSIDLTNNNLQKCLVKLNVAKDSLEVNKIYFLQIDNGEDFTDRRINILDDTLNMHQYYYDRNGITFNHDFKILTSNTSVGGALRKKRKSKKRSHKNIFK